MTGKYIVKSGQNIFDVAIMLHGSIEGVFDLLLSNDGLAYDTQLNAGDELIYHTEFDIDSSVSKWFSTSGIVARNGHNKMEHASIQSIFSLWLYMYDTQAYDALMLQPDYEIKAYWDEFSNPRLIILHNGIDCEIPMWLYTNTYLVVDWGDCSSPQVIGHTDNETELAHSYNGNGTHTIKMYGNFRFYALDLSGIDGTCYLTEPVYVDELVNIKNIDSELTTLFQ